MKTLIIDNYDSYTYNLYQIIAEINGTSPIVIRNDECSWEAAKAAYEFDNVVLSPGPGSADQAADFGICKDALKEEKLPILGVCLGHQGLGHIHGARIISSPEIAHGKISRVKHDGDRLFEGIPSSFQVVRYHSLLLDNSLPASLMPLAWTEDGLLMAIRAVDKPHWGVQFHPESIASEHGEALLRNFMNITRSFYEEANGEEAILVKGQLTQQHRYPSAGETKQGFESAWSGTEGTLDAASISVQHKGHVRYRKLSQWYDSEQVFVELYGDQTTAYWLDSSRDDGNMSRFSFMGDTRGPLSKRVAYDANTQKVTVIDREGTQVLDQDIFSYLDQELARFKMKSPALPFDFNSGFVGFYGYEAKGDIGDSTPREYPDAMFIFSDRFIAFDQLLKEVYLVCLTEDAEAADTWMDAVCMQLEQLSSLKTSFKSAAIRDSLPEQGEIGASFHYHVPHNSYLDSIAQVKKYLAAGDSYEINLTNELRVEAELAPLALYRNVRRMNPAPYAAYLTFNEELQLICSSPERFIRVGRERQIDAKPIKGTIRRGKDVSEDEQLKQQLAASQKDFSENLMIVDLLRNDLGKVCEIGTVKVPKLMDIESFETVHQLVSTITGQLRSDVPLNACIQAVFPGGSMTGAPKKRSMEIIEKLEKRPRGAYAGAIGFLGLNGTADLNIVIRTIVRQGKRLSIGVGGAIVMDSEPELEYQEIELKARALVEAIQYTLWSEQGEPSMTQSIDKKAGAVLSR